MVAGAAVGFILLGVLDRVLALAVATQTRERVLKSAMNLYFEFAQLGEIQVQESAARTYLQFRWNEFQVHVEISRPAPPGARAVLKSRIPSAA